MKNGIVRFTTGFVLGYCLMQGLAYVNTHYLWTLFYRV